MRIKNKYNKKELQEHLKYYRKNPHLTKEEQKKVKNEFEKECGEMLKEKEQKKILKDVDFIYLLDFNFMRVNDYKKLKKIIYKYFYKNTPFGKMPDKNKIELFKKIYLKLNNEVKNV